MKKIRFWFYHVLIAIDQLLNAITGGYADETLSSRCYRRAKLTKQPKKRWRVLYRTFEAIFFWEGGEHCKTAYESEVKRRQYPTEFSKIS